MFFSVMTYQILIHMGGVLACLPECYTLCYDYSRMLCPHHTPNPVSSHLHASFPPSRQEGWGSCVSSGSITLRPWNAAWPCSFLRSRQCLGDPLLTVFLRLVAIS